MNNPSFNPLLRLLNGIGVSLASPVHELRISKTSKDSLGPATAIPQEELTFVDLQIPRPKELLKDLVEKHSLEFAYIRRKSIIPGNFLRHGGMTVAYRPVTRGGSILEISTSICSDSDPFNKVEGKLIAAQRFDEGQRVMIKAIAPGMYRKSLEAMFAVEVLPFPVYGKRIEESSVDLSELLH